jgi:two-component system sensor histidine kinase SenX3
VTPTLAVVQVQLVVVVALIVAVGVAAGLWARAAERRRITETIIESVERAGLTLDEGPDPVAAGLATFERTVADCADELTAVRSMRHLLEDALDGLPQGVLIIDATGAVVHRNAAAETFARARHADALVEAAVGELVTSALGGLPDRRELELYGPPRRVLVVEVAPITATGGNAAVAVIDDITEHRRLEAVRRDFVANISHELKTPVGAIGLLAETLLGEDDPAVASRLAGRIQSESLRVGRTIDDLLDLSRIETSSVDHPDSVALDGIIGEAVSRIHPAAEQAGISIDVSGVDHAIEVPGDARQLTSAVSNLLDNAVKYSDPGSTVEVGAELGEDGRVSLTVADHGIGIPARDLERIFERFYRVDQGRSRETGGTGLGLAIVRHVAVNHHGTVEVESRLGEGSVFTLRVPATATVAVPSSHEELVR